MSEPVKTPEEETTSPQVEKKTPSKRGRMSFIERAQKESEELVKNMGGSLELEGGRRTRSSARGTPSRATITPPPTKKSRNSPASPKTTPRGRGRGRKLDTSTTPEPSEQPSQEHEDEEKVKVAEATSAELTVGKAAELAKEKAADKDKSLSETNGPEQSEGEQVNDSEAAEIKQTEQSVVAKPEETKTDNEQSVKDNNKPLVDKTDAVVESKSLPEDELEAEQKQQNNIDEHHQSKKEEKEEVQPKAKDEPVKETPADAVDSPMEVDNEAAAEKPIVAEESSEPKKVAESASIGNVEIVQNTEQKASAVVSDKVVSTPIVEESIKPFGVERKLPTPEPMEVDSSSKSSDVVECTDVVDKASVVVDNNTLEEKATAPIEEKIPAPAVEAPVIDETVKAPVQIVTQPEQKIEANANSVVTAIGNDIVPPPPLITLLPTPEEIKSINTTASAIEETKLEAISEKQSENNVVEPKLAAEVQVQAAGDAAVTTS